MSLFLRRFLCTSLTVFSASALTVCLAQPATSSPENTINARPAQPSGAPFKSLKDHLNGLHDQLKLTPQQENAWQGFFKMATEFTPSPAPSIEVMMDASIVKRTEQMVKTTKENLQHLEEVYQKIQQLYATLTPEQQKYFDQNAIGGRKWIETMRQQAPQSTQRQ